MTDTDLIGMRLSERLDPVRGFMKLYYVKTMSDSFEIPTPRDLPQYRENGNGWRVLLLGNGPTHGWGVFSHRYALTGQLGLAMTERCGYAVNIDYVGDEMMNTQTAINWLDGVDLALYDQVIVATSWNDAVRITPERIWEPAMTQLVQTLHTRTRVGTSLVLVGTEPIASSRGYGGLAAKLGQRHADKLNSTLRAIAEANGDVYMALSARQGSTEDCDQTAYRCWAQEIAAVAVPRLPQGRPPAFIGEADLQFKWIGAPLALGFGHHGRAANSRLVQLQEQATEAFGMPMALITLINGDRQWLAGHLGPKPAQVPLDLTYCSVAIQQDEPLIVTNGNTDPRFKGNPYIEQSHMPFYVGQALKSREGEVIGTFCIFGGIPFFKQAISLKKFKRYALRAQNELWRIEDEARSLAGLAPAMSPEEFELELAELKQHVTVLPIRKPILPLQLPQLALTVG